MLPSNTVLLISGGIDSFCQWRLLGKPRAIYFAIGHRYQDRELEKIRLIQKDFGEKIIVDSSLKIGQYEMDNAYLPNRNLLFIILASYYSPNIILAQIAEWAPDKNKRFYRKTEKLLKEITTGSFQGLEGKNVKVYTPFAKYTKTELVREYSKRWSADDLTKYTVSCYSDGKVNCGKCTACYSRWLAMTNNGIYEKYEVMPNKENFQRKWNIKDFRFLDLPMYIKRWKEIKEFRKKIGL